MNQTQSQDTEFCDFRVRPVTRYIVTRYDGVRHANGMQSGGIPRQLGNEFASADTAYEVAYALARQETEHKGYYPGDERVGYPKHPLDGAGDAPMLVNSPLEALP